MADLVITAASVVAGSNAQTFEGTLGVAVTAGQGIVRDPTTRKYVLADSNHATAALRVAEGLALHGGAANQPVKGQKAGDITIGAALTAGLAYYQSDTPGGICPIADVGSGETPVVLGMARSATVLALDIQSTGVTL